MKSFSQTQNDPLRPGSPLFSKWPENLIAEVFLLFPLAAIIVTHLLLWLRTLFAIKLTLPLFPFSLLFRTRQSDDRKTHQQSEKYAHPAAAAWTSTRATWLWHRWLSEPAATARGGLFPAAASASVGKWTRVRQQPAQSGAREYATNGRVRVRVATVQRRRAPCRYAHRGWVGKCWLGHRQSTSGRYTRCMW